jgi:hypothetical protein
LARATLLQIQQAGIGDITGVIWESSHSTSFVFAPSFFNGFVRSTAAAMKAVMIRQKGRKLLDRWDLLSGFREHSHGLMTTCESIRIQLIIPTSRML